MKNQLFTRASLSEILSSLNAGLVDIQNHRNVFITSTSKPGFYIQLVEIDVREPIKYLLNINGVLPKNVDKKTLKVETSCYDYIVSTLTVDTDGSPLYSVMSLFELVTATNSLLASEDGIHSIDKSDGWNMEDKIWDCVEFIK